MIYTIANLLSFKITLLWVCNSIFVNHFIENQYLIILLILNGKNLGKAQHVCSRTKLGQEKDSSFQLEGSGNKAVSLEKYFSGGGGGDFGWDKVFIEFFLWKQLNRSRIFQWKWLSISYWEFQSFNEGLWIAQKKNLPQLSHSGLFCVTKYKPWYVHYNYNRC